MKNGVTVVPADNIIIVDGLGLHFEFPAPATLHALQWHNGSGHMEWTDDLNRKLTPNDYAAEVAPFVALWEAEKQRLDDIANRPPTLAEVHAAKVTEIMRGSNACAGVVKSRYTELEIDSWTQQRAEAETVLAGGTLPADALLTVLASANGVTVADFAARVMANVQTAEAVTKFVVSQQQGYEARLKAIMADTATDDAGKIAAIQGIVVKYELPEG